MLKKKKNANCKYILKYTVTFVFSSSQVKNEAKLKSQNNDIKSLELNTLQTPTPLLFYGCNRQTKIKSEVNYKMKII